MKPNYEAEKIFAEIQQRLNGMNHILEFDVENPDAVRSNLRKRLKDTKQHVVISVVREYRHNLIVNIKSMPRVLVLEDLLRRCMNHVDDEHLYEEIFNAIKLAE